MAQYNNRQIVGLFPMCADLLHAGHVIALEEARQHCDKLIVALNTHPDGKSPVQTVYERWVQLAGIRWVDRIILYQGRKDMELIAATFEYDVRFLGSDYEGKTWDGKEQEELRGIKPHFIQRLHSLSSSELKDRIIGGVADGR